MCKLLNKTCHVDDEDIPRILFIRIYLFYELNLIGII